MQEYTSPSERLKALTDQLEQGVSDIFQSGQYATYLTAMSKFHHYSFGNTMLIFMQCPNATNVAGYHDWRRNFGRQVKRGERGITILAPCPYRRKEEVEEAASDGSPATSVQWVQRMGFRTVTVFDVSQTEGKPLPELVKKLTGDVAQYESMVVTLRSISPYPISIESFPGGAYGCCNFAEQRIFVQPDMSQAQTIKTMIHEVSHAKLHRAGGYVHPVPRCQPANAGLSVPVRRPDDRLCQGNLDRHWRGVTEEGQAVKPAPLTSLEKWGEII